MNVIFVTSGTYPDGGAATNRHLAYAKGLLELGHEVDFILLKSQKWHEPMLIEQGIRFTCVWDTPGKKSSKLSKAFAIYNSIHKANQIITTKYSENFNTVVVLLDTSVLILLPLIHHARRNRIKLFHERTEYPFVVGGRTFISRINLAIYLNFVIAKFDGIYVINNALKKYFSDRLKDKVKLCVINMIVDPARFELPQVKKPTQNKIISYCGSIEGDKDGIMILIEAFSIIAKEYPFVSLQLINSSRSVQARQRVITFVNKLGISDRVQIMGPFLRHEIPGLLCNSDILALARPNNIQAEGGFPTKLGEYLATGNPVVVSNVGEIGLFLKDGLNAYVSIPDSAGEFAKKLREAITSDNADEIGMEGKKLVYKDFNYLVQSKKLVHFFESEI